MISKIAKPLIFLAACSIAHADEQAVSANEENAQAREVSGFQNPQTPIFLSSDPNSHLTTPDARAAMRINPEAPGPFIGLASAYFQGDMGTAKAYAKQYVRYLADLTFAVRDITSLIGEALIEEGKIDEEEWVGVEQYLDRQMVQARSDMGSPIKATHEDALAKIKSDPKGEIEVYYLFTLNSSNARKMAPDVERLWQYAKTDPRIKMVGLTLGAQPKEWIASYKNYTGLTLPIFNGEQVAKTFRVSFVPAVVIVTPNSPAAYLKTGEQNFQRMYEFVRKAQGESLELTNVAKKITNHAVGKAQISKAGVITAEYREVELEPEQLHKF